MSNWAKATLGFVLTTLFSACSSDTAAEGRVTQAHYPDAFAEAWCGAIAPCCEQGGAAYDPAQCRAKASEAARATLAVRLGPSTAFDEGLAASCLRRLRLRLAQCRIEDASSACQLIFTGSAPLGAPCVNGSACSSGYCALGEALSGVCSEAREEAPRHGQQGDACVGSCGVPGSFECPDSGLPSATGPATYCYAAEGLYCAFDPDAIESLTCQPYAALGASCELATCTPGAFCDQGSCAAQQDSGPCGDTPEICSVFHYCDPDGQCQPQKPNASPCVSGEECLSSSCGSAGRARGSCDGGSNLTAQACAGQP